MPVLPVCCNKKVKIREVWYLKDIKGFTARRLAIGKCPICNDDVVMLIEKRIEDNQVFEDNLNGINAVKTIYREKKRRLITIDNIRDNELYGWIYGVNVEIKNKNQKITQVRQYSSDFSGNKKLAKKIFM